MKSKQLQVFLWTTMMMMPIQRADLGTTPLAVQLLKGRRQGTLAVQPLDMGLTIPLRQV